MKGYNLRLLLVVLFLTSMLFPFMPHYVYASNITNADWYGVITISNNDTAATNIITTGNWTTDALVAGGFIDADAENVVIRDIGGNDVAFMPTAGNWQLFVPSINANSYQSNLMYTGDVSEGKLAYFPSPNGMLSDDDATLEPANNFSIEQSCFIDNAAIGPGVLVQKQLIFYTYMPTAGNITSVIGGSGVTTVPTGFSDPSGDWGGEANAYDINTATGADITGAAAGDSWSSNITFTHAGVVCDGIEFYAESDADWTEIDVDAEVDGTWYDLYEGTYIDLNYEFVFLPYASGNVTQTRVRFFNDNAAPQTEVDLLREIYFFDINAMAKSVSATVTTGEHIIKTMADGTDMKLYIDDVEEDSVGLGVASVTDFPMDWRFFIGSKTPYMLAQNITVGGNLEQQITWEYDTDTFTDGSGNGNDAFPSYRATGTDDDVTAWLSFFGPVSEAKAPAYAIATPPDFITTAPNITGNFSTTITPTLPGADAITDIAAAGGVPSQLPWFIITGFAILVFSLGISYTMRRFGSGSIFVKALTVIIGMGFCVGVGIYDLWILLFYAIPAIAIMMASRQPTWG